MGPGSLVVFFPSIFWKQYDGTLYTGTDCTGLRVTWKIYKLECIQHGRIMYWDLYLISFKIICQIFTRLCYLPKRESMMLPSSPPTPPMRMIFHWSGARLKSVPKRGGNSFFSEDCKSEVKWINVKLYENIFTRFYILYFKILKIEKHVCTYIFSIVSTLARKRWRKMLFPYKLAKITLTYNTNYIFFVRII